MTSDIASEAASLDRIRGICARFPETEEGLLQDRPLFHVRRRRFAILNGDASPPRMRWAAFGSSLHFANDPDHARRLLSDPRFRESPHHGFRGWRALDLTHEIDWTVVGDLLEHAYRSVAPKELVAELDAQKTNG